MSVIQLSSANIRLFFFTPKLISLIHLKIEKQTFTGMKLPFYCHLSHLFKAVKFHFLSRKGFSTGISSQRASARRLATTCAPYIL